MPPLDLPPGFDKLTRALERLSSERDIAVNKADVVTKSSLRLGMSFDKAFSELGGTVRDLRGGIEDRFVPAFELLNAGLRGNQTSVAKLINQQILTGDMFAATAPVFARLNQIAGIQNSELQTLATVSRELGAQYQISTSKLVQTLDFLGKRFGDFRLAGFGPQIEGAAMRLTSVLGPMFADRVGRAISDLFDPSLDNFTRMSILGIEDFRMRIGRATNEEQAFKLLVQAMNISAERFSDITGTTITQYLNLGIATELFGEAGKNFSVISKQLKEASRERLNTTLDYQKQYTILKEEIFVPLKIAFMQIFYPPLVTATEALRDFVFALTEDVNPAIKAVKEWVKEFDLRSKIMNGLEMFGNLM